MHICQPLLLTLLATFAASAVAIDNARQPAVVRMSMLQPAVKIDHQQQPSVKLLGFSWSDCSGAGAWMKIKSASVQPDPISVNGKITIAFSIVVSHAFGDGPAVAAAVKIEKKVFGTWLKIPCVDNVGSCDYANLCTVSPPPAQCPPEFQKAKVPCKCPFAVGNYTLPSYTFTVDASKIPKFLESGTYRVSVDAHVGASQVLCVNSQLSLN